MATEDLHSDASNSTNSSSHWNERLNSSVAISPFSACERTGIEPTDFRDGVPSNFPSYRKLCHPLRTRCSKTGFFTTVICLSFLCLVGGSIVGSFLSSLFMGTSSYRETSSSHVVFYSKLVEDYISASKGTLVSLASSPILRKAGCGDPSSITLRAAESFLQVTAQGLGTIWLHHLRLIGASGAERIRIDLDHSQVASISTLKYNVSTTPYHDYFRVHQMNSCSHPDSLASDSVIALDWTTHPTSQPGSMVPVGDHHPAHGVHEEDEAPSLMRLQMPVRCSFENNSIITETRNGTLCPRTAETYVVMNLRMELVLSRIHNRVKREEKVIILDRSGEYLFNSADRSREFERMRREYDHEMMKRREPNVESDARVEISPFESDWGSGTVAALFDTNHPTSPSVISLDSSHEVICSWIGTPTSSLEYRICILHSIFEAFLLRPTPFFLFLILLIPSPFVFITARLCQARQKAEREKMKLLRSFYPQQFHCDAFQSFDELQIVPKRRDNVGVHWIEMVQFEMTTYGFSAQAMLEWVGSVRHVMDAMAVYYGIQQIRFVGDFVLSVSNLDGKSRGKTGHLLKMIEYALALRYFFFTREMKLLSTQICLRKCGDQTKKGITPPAIDSLRQLREKKKKKKKRKVSTSPSTVVPILPTVAFRNIIQTCENDTEDVLPPPEEEQDFPWDDLVFYVRMPLPHLAQLLDCGSLYCGIVERLNQACPSYEIIGHVIKNMAREFQLSARGAEVVATESVRELLESKQSIRFVGVGNMNERQSSYRVEPRDLDCFAFEEVIHELEIDGVGTPFYCRHSAMSDSMTDVSAISDEVLNEDQHGWH